MYQCPNINPVGVCAHAQVCMRERAYIYMVPHRDWGIATERKQTSLIRLESSHAVAQLSRRRRYPAAVGSSPPAVAAAAAASRRRALAAARQGARQRTRLLDARRPPRRSQRQQGPRVFHAAQGHSFGSVFHDGERRGETVCAVSPVLPATTRSPVVYSFCRATRASRKTTRHPHPCKTNRREHEPSRQGG